MCISYLHMKNNLKNLEINMLKKTLTALLMSAAVSGTLVFSTACSEDIEGNEQNHPTYVKAKQSRDAGKYQDAADLLNDLLSKAPNSTFLHRELAQLYGDHLYDYHRAIYHYERHLELSKTLSSEDKGAIKSYIDICKKKSAEEVLKNNPQLAPKDPAAATNAALLDEKEKRIQQLEDENKAKHDQYLELYSKYAEARKRLVEYAERQKNAPVATVSTTTTETTVPRPAVTTVATESGDFLIYKVQAGDYPSKIAKKHGISVKRFMEVNGLTEESAKRIKIGQELKIPKK